MNSKFVLRKRMAEKNICPRCEGLIPNNNAWGEYIGAVSRLTRRPNQQPVYICSDCGSEEGLQDYFEGKVTPITEWPVSHEDAVTRRMQAFEILSRVEEQE